MFFVIIFVSMALTSVAKDAVADDAAQVRIFFPKRWTSSDGKEVAFTIGDNPADYFKRSNSGCRRIVKSEVSSISDIRFPRSWGDYVSLAPSMGNGVVCKTIYIYEVYSEK